MRRYWVLAMATCFALLIALVTHGFQIDLSHADWAAWVQAVGSIIAIASGFVLVAWSEERATRARFRHLQNAAVTGLRHLLLQLWAIRRASGQDSEPVKPQYVAMYLQQYDEALSYVKALPIWEMEEVLAFQLLALIRGCELYRSAVGLSKEQRERALDKATGLCEARLKEYSPSDVWLKYLKEQQENGGKGWHLD